MLRNRQMLSGLPARIRCEGEMLWGRKAASHAKPFECLARQAVAEYKSEGYAYASHLQDYASTGDFLNYGLNPQTDYSNFDGNGIPRVKYQGELCYNPVTIANFTLSMYGRNLRGDRAAGERFLKGANHLISMQDSEGAFRYLFPWKYYLTGRVYQPGWASGMAQGLALSVFARAYQLTNDRKYLNAGDKAFDFLVTPISKGGVMDTLGDVDSSLQGNIMFEEYVATPSGHTLNGYMYTLLGVYDWSRVSVDRGNDARSYFNRGIDTLKRILPYYDIGGFTSYDLGYITYRKKPCISVGYHAVHIYLLHALASITGEVEFTKYEKLWASYVQQ